MREEFDLLGEDGRALGTQKPRDEVHRDGDWHATVHIWVRDLRGDIVLQRRSMKKDTHPGKWDLSAAGHVDAGEEIMEAAIRELQEELGVKATSSDLRFLGVVKNIHQDDEVNDREFVHVFLYRERVFLDSLHYPKDEIEELATLSPRDLKKHSESGDPDLVPHPREMPLLFVALEHS